MKPKTLQLHYLELALKESKIKYKSHRVDHPKGCCYVDNKPKGMIFPQSMINLCEGLWDERSIDYFFKGVLTPNREWCNMYTDNSIVKSSTRGRNDKLKFKYDVDYYTALGRTKFALAPVGDCPWSYRFFEAMMCGAIPVLGDTDEDIWSKDFKFFRHSEDKEYNEDWVEYNFKKVKESCLL